ncbi:uroporphyrinogen-III synthase [Agarivorans sp. Z349TD_8]|uniref:uroporphyrinogen-III synthase n=1 Tax=Agarivorans sp. Z349TD_8 TaxID=3421434 RepID=UPI003D7CAE4C
MVPLLITRPQPHNQRCVETLGEHGFSAIAAPMVEIISSPELARLKQVLSSTTPNGLIVAVSQYAVEACQQWLEQQQLSWPRSLQYLAVGKATAECWQQYGVKASVPSRQDSEGMLQLIEQQFPGLDQATILRGQQGRDWLAQQLQTRGVKVTYLSCYQRKLITYPQQQLEQWRLQINTIVATSGEILKHLTTLMSKAEQLEWLRECHLLVPSQRLLKYAQSLGFMHIVLCDGASDKACIEALKQILPSARNENDQR